MLQKVSSSQLERSSYFAIPTELVSDPLNL